DGQEEAGDDHGDLSVPELASPCIEVRIRKVEVGRVLHGVEVGREAVGWIDLAASRLVLEAAEWAGGRRDDVAGGVGVRDLAVRARGLVGLAQPAAVGCGVAAELALSDVVVGAEAVAPQLAVAVARDEVAGGAVDGDAGSRGALELAVEITVWVRG